MLLRVDCGLLVVLSLALSIRGRESTEPLKLRRINSVEDLERLAQIHDYFTVGYFPDEESAEARAYMEAVADYKDLVAAISSSVDIRKIFGLNEGETGILMEVDGGRALFREEYSVKNMKDWIEEDARISAQLDATRDKAIEDVEKMESFPRRVFPHDGVDTVTVHENLDSFGNNDRNKVLKDSIKPVQIYTVHEFITFGEDRDYHTIAYFEDHNSLEARAYNEAVANNPDIEAAAITSNDEIRNAMGVSPGAMGIFVGNTAVSMLIRGDYTAGNIKEWMKKDKITVMEELRVFAQPPGGVKRAPPSGHPISDDNKAYLADLKTMTKEDWDRFISEFGTLNIENIAAFKKLHHADKKDHSEL